MVLSPNEDRVLMCQRAKEPYKGLYNLVGGKIEKDEDYLASAYRELFEETGITDEYIKLFPFMVFRWNIVDMEMHVFIGRLDDMLELKNEVNELKWVDIEENFFDTLKFAGQGNIGHMVKIFQNNRSKIFKD
jgi:8-oxo-dGTP diphosphatase